VQCMTPNTDKEDFGQTAMDGMARR
jgi:hypothetical protein